MHLPHAQFMKVILGTLTLYALILSLSLLVHYGQTNLKTSYANKSIHTRQCDTNP